jgi:hypothetical protein
MRPGPTAPACALAAAAALAVAPALAKTPAFPIELVRKLCFDGGLALDGVKAMVRGVMGDPSREETAQRGGVDFWNVTAMSREGADDRQAMMLAFVGQDRGRSAPEPNILRITGFVDTQRALASLKTQRGLRFGAVERDKMSAQALDVWSVKGNYVGRNKTTTLVELSSSKVTTTVAGRPKVSNAYIFTCTRTIYLGDKNHPAWHRDGSSLAARPLPVHV